MRAVRRLDDDGAVDDRRGVGLRRLRGLRLDRVHCSEMGNGEFGSTSLPSSIDSAIVRSLAATPW
jgi:hypothetical protein